MSKIISFIADDNVAVIKREIRAVSMAHSPRIKISRFEARAITRHDESRHVVLNNAGYALSLRKESRLIPIKSGA